MKKITISLIAAAAMNVVVFAGGDLVQVEPIVTVPQAQDHSGQYYFGLGMGIQRTYSTDSDWFDNAATQDRTLSLVGMWGYTYNPYLAFEGRVSQSIAYEDIVDVFTYSFFVKPQYPVTEAITTYALLGYGGVNVDDTVGILNVDKMYTLDIEETGFQWGLGLSYAYTQDIAFFADYTSLMDDQMGITDKVSNEAITVGVIYNY